MQSSRNRGAMLAGEARLARLVRRTQLRRRLRLRTVKPPAHPVKEMDPV